ncbi:MAG: Ig-like domain-containing protein, partial [Bacteroidota bacterium]|nr:Ig-like domain-containing protein [Bacteroidota bacterium]
GTRGAFAGSGTTYTLAVTPTGGADVTVEVAANSVTDGLNTGPALAVSATATWDATVLTVTIQGVPAKINSTTAFNAEFVFSEAVTGFDDDDITIAGGTEGAFAGSGTTYTLAVTPTGSANVVVTVAADAATDGLNTGPASAVSKMATWDVAA